MIQLVALLCVFGLGSCFALLGSISVKLMPRLEIDQGKFGALVSALMLSCLTASMIVGIVIDLVGYKPVAVAGFLIAGLCTFSIAQARSYAAVLVSCVVLGFGAIALNTAGNTLLPAVLSQGTNHAAALNLGNVFFGLGVLLTPLIVSFLFQKISYEKAVSVVALMLLAPVVLAMLATYPASEPGFVVTDAFALLAEPAVVIAALMMFCYISLETSFCNWLPVFGKEVIGRARADAGIAAVDASAQRLLSLFAVAMMAGRLGASQIPGITTYGYWYIAAASLVATATLVFMSVAKSAGQAAGGGNPGRPGPGSHLSHHRRRHPGPLQLEGSRQHYRHHLPDGVPRRLDCSAGDRRLGQGIVGATQFAALDSVGRPVNCPGIGLGHRDSLIPKVDGGVLSLSRRLLMTDTAEKTIKVALVGCGSRGTGAINQALRTKGPIKLWAMADLFADRLENSLALLTKGEQASYDRAAHSGLGSQIDVPPERRFVGFDAYRQAIQSGVDMVILATSPHFRPLHYECAVEQGKHLFMEKPLAVDGPGIRRILAANEEAKRKRLKVGVGLMHRHQRGYQETIARIHAGAIGPVNLLRAYCNTSAMRDTAPRPPQMTEMQYQLRNPYNFTWLSGDYIVDNLLHFIDLCLWVRGQHPIWRKARAIGKSPIAPSAATSTPTTPWSSPSPTARGCLPPRGRSPAVGSARGRTPMDPKARRTWAIIGSKGPTPGTFMARRRIPISSSTTC